MDRIDLLVPLGSGSRSNNDELRLLLRSAEENVRDLGRVIVVTDCPPSWLQNAEVMEMGDILLKNKDGNMIRKVESAVRAFGVGRFCLMCDDFLFMKETWLSKIPAICNCRGEECFRRDGRRWERRVYRTFQYCKAHGHPVPRNFESHTPQVFDAKVLLPELEKVDYQSDIGYSIYTLFHFLCGEYEGVDQREYKTTHESVMSANSEMSRQFASYNDDAFLHGLRERLFKRFPTPSRYEKIG